MKRALTTCLMIALLACLPVQGAVEDFTEWTEVDSANWITVTDPNLITVTAMPASQISYVYRDMGAGYFAGDLEARARVKVTAGNNLSLLGVIGLSQTPADWQNLVWSAQDAIGVYWRTHSTTQRIYLDCMSNGVRSYQTLDVALNTEYYLKFLRDHDGGVNGTGRLTLYVTTGGYYGAGGSLVGTLTVDVPVGEQNAYRYAMTAYSMTNQGSSSTITGTVSDLYLAIPGGTGETPAEPQPGEDDPGEEGVPSEHGPYYVSPLGNNDADGCTPITPWRTIAYALANADLHATESYNVIYLMAGDHGSVSLTSKTWSSDSWSNEWRIQGLAGAYLTQLAISGFHDAYLDFNDVDITRTAVHAKSGRLIALTNTSDIKIRGGTLTGYWSTTDGELTTGYSIYILASGAGYIENIEIDGVTTNYSWDSIVIQGGGGNSVRNGLVVKNCTIKNWNQSGLFALWNQAARASNDPVQWLYNTIVEMNVSRVASSVSGPPHSTCLQVRGDNLIIRGNRGTNHGGSGGVRFYEDDGPFSEMTVEDNIFYAPGGVSTTAGFFQCGESVRIANNTFISGLRTGSNAAAYRYAGGVVLGVSSAVTPDIEFANNIVVGLLDLGGTSLDVITGGNNLLYSVFRSGSFLSAMEPNDIIVVKGISGPIQTGYTVSSFETAGEIFLGSSDFAAYFATTGNRPIDFSVFALPADSPAVDAGRPSMGSTYDVIGATRDEDPDIGAYEYVAESAPDKARNPIPANGATNVAVGTLLEWSGPAENWDVYVGISPTAMVYQGNQQARSLLYAMAYGTTYYWRVDANNIYGKTTGNTWNFTAETGVPSSASNPNPANNSTNVAVSRNLTWTAVVPATFYVVYLNGEFLTTTTSSSVSVSLAYDRTYTWQVESVGPGGTVNGPVWAFSTVKSESDPEVPILPGSSPGSRVWSPYEASTRPDFRSRRYLTPYESLHVAELIKAPAEPGTYVVDPYLTGYLERIVIVAEGDDTQWSLHIADSSGAVLFGDTALDMTAGVVSYDGQRIPFRGGLHITIGDMVIADRLEIYAYVWEIFTK